MRALSIRAPWAWAILNAGKDVENRCWVPKFRGECLIHAGIGCSADEYDAAAEKILRISGLRVPPLRNLQRGGIVGRAVVAGLLARDEVGSPWHVLGQVGIRLADVRELPFRELKGQLRFFEVGP